MDDDYLMDVRVRGNLASLARDLGAIMDGGTFTATSDRWSRLTLDLRPCDRGLADPASLPEAGAWLADGGCLTNITDAVARRAVDAVYAAGAVRVQVDAAYGVDPEEAYADYLRVTLPAAQDSRVAIMLALLEVRFDNFSQERYDGAEVLTAWVASSN